MTISKESNLDGFSNKELAEMFDYADDHGGYSKGFPRGQIAEELSRRLSPEESGEPTPPATSPLLDAMRVRAIRLHQRQVGSSAGMDGIGRGRANS